MNSEHKQVAVPRAFFVKAKLDYADWRWAWVREQVQNSWDAGASSLNFTISFDEQGHTVIEVCDNGCGMTRDVVENSLLTMGGSHKPNGAVGGFGVAKTLLYFANCRYGIDSRRDGMLTVVNGSGGDYAIQSLPSLGKPYTRSRTVFDDWTVDSARSYIRDYIKKFFAGYEDDRREMQFVVDGVAVDYDEDEYDDFAETELGDLFFSEVSGHSHTVLVTLGGLPMYHAHASARDGRAIRAAVALRGDYSQFTSNRDGLLMQQAIKLQDIIQQLVNERSALRAGAELCESATFNVPAVLSSTAGTNQLSDLMRTLLNRVDWTGYHEQVAVRVATSPRRRRTDSADKNVLSVGEAVKVLNQARTQKLAQQWKEQVEELLLLPTVAARLTNYMYTVRTGLLLTNRNILGMCESPNTHVRNLLFNPLKMTREWGDADDMWDVAVHEVAHLFTPNHDEMFIDVMDTIRREYRRS